MACLIRELTSDDAATYRALRVRALGEHPEAFGRTPEEVPSVETIAKFLGEDGLVLGVIERARTWQGLEGRYYDEELMVLDLT